MKRTRPLGSWAWGAAGAAALGALLTWRWSREPEKTAAVSAPAVAPATLACRFSVGDELSYRVHLKSDSGKPGSGAPNGAGDGQHVELQTVMHWRVLEPRGTGWLVAATLAGIRLDTRTSPTVDVADLGNPFLIDLGRDCRFKSLAFGPRLHDGARAQLEALLGVLEVVLPVMPVATWSARQRDAAGEYLAAYDREESGATIKRRRTRYLRLNTASSAALGGRPNMEILRSGARITLGTDGRWLSDFSSDELLAVSFHDRPLAQVAVHVELNQIDEAAPSSLHALAVDRFIWSDPTSPRPARATPRAPDAALAALDLAGALAGFQKTLTGKGGLHDAVTTLAGYLALHPDAITQLMEQLRRGNKSALDDHARSALFLALELTGTPHAERALAGAIGDLRMTEVDRMRAAVALADVAHPSPQAFDALVAGTRQVGNQDVAGSSLLALGMLGRNAATSQPELAAKVRSELTARLTRDGNVDVIPTLAAVGNFGDAALLSAVTPYTADPSPTIRAHAAGAFRRSSDPGGEAQLIGWLARENDPTVRRAILETLTERARSAGGSVSKSLLAAAIARLPAESDAQSRGLLIKLLGGSAATVPDAKQALVEHFHREANVELLQLIGQFCNADELG